MRDKVAYTTLVGLVAYAAIATDLYLPAIPSMVESFGATESDGQLTLSTFMIGMALGQLIFGPLSDFYGRLPVVKAGTVVFLLTSIACALSSTIEMMWITRTFQGLAAASGLVIARAIVSDRYHANEAAKVMSALAAAMAIVPLIAPNIGAWVLLVTDWRGTFALLAVFALTILVGLKTFEESAPNIGVGELSFRGVFRQFSVCLTDVRFLGFQLCGSGAFSAIFAYLSTVSFFLYDVFEIPTEYFGFAFAVTVMGFMSGSMFCSRLVTRLGSMTTMTLGCVISAVAGLAQLLLAIYSENVIAIGIAAFLIFFGIGLTSANASMGAVGLYRERAGAASAVYGFTHGIIAASVGYISGLVYDGTLVSTAIVIAVALVASLCGLFLVNVTKPVEGN